MNTCQDDGLYLRGCGYVTLPLKPPHHFTAGNSALPEPLPTVINFVNLTLNTYPTNPRNQRRTPCTSLIRPSPQYSTSAYHRHNSASPLRNFFPFVVYALPATYFASLAYLARIHRTKKGVQPTQAQVSIKGKGRKRKEKVKKRKGIVHLSPSFIISIMTFYITQRIIRRIHSTSRIRRHIRSRTMSE
jgi:hypothetical protein